MDLLKPNGFRYFLATNRSYILNNAATISLSVASFEKPYADITALSFASWALRKAAGVVRGLYKSAREASGNLERASKIACAVFSIFDFCSSVVYGGIL